MPLSDLSLAELKRYRPEPWRQPDFAEFWSATLAQARAEALSAVLEPVAHHPLRGVACHRVTFAGLGGAPVTGWLVRPEGRGPFPAVACFHGYGGQGARPLELFTLAAQGMVAISMDCRGQPGGPPDALAGGGQVVGWLTQGLSSPDTQYYRFVYADAVRILEVLCQLPEVDPERVGVTGASQGGGLALAAAALSDRPAAAWADIPFLCDFRRVLDVAGQPPYTEVADILRRQPGLAEQAWRALSYVDVLNLASMVTCPTRVTCGLWDEVCPPSTIFAAFAQVASGDKELQVLPYHRHELTYEVDVARLTFFVNQLGT